MHTFRVISIAGFVVVLVGVACHCAVSRPSFERLFGEDRKLRGLDWLRIGAFGLTLLLIPQKVNLAGALRKLVYLVALACFVILFVTGFVPKLILGETISGYWLMLHATAAPVFAGCMAILAVMWAHECRLDKNYLPWLHRVLQRQPKNKATPEKHELGRKAAFWVIIFLTLPLILSAVVSMFSFFGTYWQELLAQLHRYTALVLALVVIVHTYLMVLTEAKK